MYNEENMSKGRVQRNGLPTSVDSDFLLLEGDTKSQNLDF